jgi:phosphohistidine phosphatase
LGSNLEELKWDPDLYLCAADDWLLRLKEWNPGVGHVITVGHNPGITQLANRLSLAGIDNVPTAGVVAMEFNCGSWSELEWGLATLTWFDYPKLHGG